MREITPESLESLPSRVAYMREFINFTEKDVEALRVSKPQLAPLIPIVADMAYKRTLDFTITAKIFDQHQDGHTGENSVSLADLFAKYIVKLVSMDYDDPKSWEYLDKVGRMHTGVADTGFKHRAKKPNLRVEYIHCGILLGYVEDIVMSAVIDHPQLDQETKLAVVKAINKLMWLQNDLFARHFIKSDPKPWSLKWQNFLLPFATGVIAVSLLRSFRVFN